MSGRPSRAACELVGLGRPLSIAHRGDSSCAPENTLPAFELAVSQHVDFVELDFHATADGALVVIHDDTLDRTTNAVARWGQTAVAVASRSLAEIQSLDAGGWFASKYAGAVAPTLEAALELILAGACVAIERKAGQAADVVALLKRLGAVEQVVLQAFDWAFLAECHRLAPSLLLAALGEHQLSTARLDAAVAVAAGATLVSWDETQLDRQAVDAAHERGLKVWAWTVDAPERMTELLDFGVDGLVSNTPDELIRVLSHYEK